MPRRGVKLWHGKHMWHLPSPPRSLAALAFSLATVFIPLAAPQAQTGPLDDRAAGIAAFEKGDAGGATKFLKAATKKNKTDLVAWYWLGRSYEQQGKTGDARKSYEKAAKLGDSLLTAELEGPIENWPLRMANLKSLLTIAAASADAYVRLNPKLSRSKAEEWSERLDFLRDPWPFGDSTNVRIYRSKEVTTRARVLSKPEPSYTESARQHLVVGTVLLRAIFAEDGRVRGIYPLRRLPHGLTSAAIRAARQIKFIPATKDGKPVSMWMQLEYNFNIY